MQTLEGMADIARKNEGKEGNRKVKLIKKRNKVTAKIILSTFFCKEQNILSI